MPTNLYEQQTSAQGPQASAADFGAPAQAIRSGKAMWSRTSAIASSGARTV